MKTSQNPEPFNLYHIKTPNRLKCRFCGEANPNIQEEVCLTKVSFHIKCHPQYIEEALKDPKRTLVLHLKREYFEAIRKGTKREEYRLFKEYWKKRIHHNEFEFILLYLGYPKANDYSKRIVCHYTGHEVKDIKHPEFGEKRVRVFALFVDRKVW